MSTERSKNASNRQIIDEAAAWFVEINEGEPDRETRERFDDWLRRSPEHARAYLRILPLWEEGAQLDTQANGDPQALIAWARAENNVVPLDPGSSSESVGQRIGRQNAVPRRRSALPLALAAAAGVLSLVLGGWWLFDHRNLYETGVGEQRLITLEDGSRVELNSRSRLRVRFDAHERGLELLAGQALFRAAKEARRPFVVRSGDVLVRALGTQFDVYLKPTGTVVTVVEGRVAVAPSRAHSAEEAGALRPMAGESPVVLAAGQQTVVASKTIPEPVAANVSAATAWTQQRLEFSMTPLAEVVEEFNRYNERQLIVRDGKLRDFHVTGTFSSSDPGSLITFLKAQDGVRIEENGDEDIVISAR